MGIPGFGFGRPKLREADPPYHHSPGVNQRIADERRIEHENEVIEELWNKSKYPLAFAGLVGIGIFFWIEKNPEIFEAIIKSFNP